METRTDFIIAGIKASQYREYYPSVLIHSQAKSQIAVSLWDRFDGMVSLSASHPRVAQSGFRMLRSLVNELLG